MLGHLNSQVTVYLIVQRSHLGLRVNVSNACHMKDRIILCKICMFPNIIHRVHRIHLKILGFFQQPLLYICTNKAVGSSNQNIFHCLYFIVLHFWHGIRRILVIRRMIQIMLQIIQTAFHLIMAFIESTAILAHSFPFALGK